MATAAPPTSPVLAEIDTLRARRAVEDARRVHPVSLAGSFDSSRRHRMDSRNPAALASSNAHRDRWTLEEQIRRCTDACRNNTLFRAIVRTLEDWAVGPAPDIVPNSEDTAFNEAVVKWLEWADETRRFDARGMMTLGEMAGSGIVALACGGRVLFPKVAGGGAMAIEPERIGNPSGRADGRDTDGTSWIGGVHLDSFGRVIEYNVYDYDASGTSFRLTMNGGTRVPAPYGVYVVRPSLREVNQIVGEPALQSLLRRIYDVDDNIDNTNWSYYQATLISVIFESKDPTELQRAMFASAAAAQPDAGLPTTSGGTGWDAAAEMQRAMMMAAPEGTKASVVDPKNPSQQIEPWIWLMMQLACADVGVPVELVFARFIRNYSASRGAIAVGWPRVERWQGAARAIISPIYRHRLAADLRAGRVPGVTEVPKDWYRHTVILPPMPVLDPAQDVKYLKEAIDARLMDYEPAVRMLNGEDYRVVHARLAAQTRELKRLGIEPVAMPGAGGGAGESAKGPKGQSAKEDGAEGNNE